MPQKLFVKVTTPAGEEAMREVKILRTFSHATKGQLFQHTNGIFGYKDGAPVQSETELDMITHPLHRRAAQIWWERIGRAMSEKYYAAQRERERARIGDYRPTDGVDNTELDAALYYRQPENAAEGDGIEGPFSWMDLFPKRPDWWGQARAIQFKDYHYLQESEEQAPLPPLPLSDTATDIARTPPPTTPYPGPGEDLASERAEEAERQALMAEIKERFPQAAVHPATGLKKLKEKYLELQAQAEEEARLRAAENNKEPGEFE